ncbi:REP-associated tyrosine transposase [Bradyrhizobium yuanmingense]|uniref:REP-associated tyrosine transposase n=1 Tax=Bradyrhizobium yuanmingense TaxID=108015 RepID=UPI0023BA2B6D|nr:hypothetical protein [Bradyrhizobium yuanmingense]MDF0494400.1 hypothetical protein [Bradyrhizobium yuanmingense]
MRWQLIESTFSRRLARNESISQNRSAKGERGIWKRRYWEHTIRDDVDFARHVDYVHINPVKHGLVNRVRDWAPSSFHRHVKLGNDPVDWAGDQSDDGRDYGERRQRSDGFRKGSTHPTNRHSGARGARARNPWSSSAAVEWIPGSRPRGHAPE